MIPVATLDAAIHRIGEVRRAMQDIMLSVPPGSRIVSAAAQVGAQCDKLESVCRSLRREAGVKAPVLPFRRRQRHWDSPGGEPPDSAA